jgi:hypothetical protein
VEIAVVVIERSRTFHGREEHIGQSVTVDVAHGNAGTDEQISIGERLRIIDVVTVREAGARAIELRKMGRASSGHAKRAPAIASLAMPGDVDRLPTRCEERPAKDAGG